MRVPRSGLTSSFSERLPTYVDDSILGIRTIFIFDLFKVTISIVLGNYVKQKI